MTIGHLSSCGIESCGDGRPCSCPCHQLAYVTEIRDELQRQLDDLREQHESLKFRHADMESRLGEEIQALRDQIEDLKMRA